MKAKDIVKLALLRAVEVLRIEADDGESPEELYDNDAPEVNEEQEARWRVALRDLADRIERKATSKGKHKSVV